MMASRPLALVTGASSGIGRALAELLAREGHDLVVVARRRDRLEALAAQLAEWDAKVEVVIADLTDAADLARVAGRAAETGPALLVNNAGFSGYGPFSEIDPDVMRGVIAIHVTAPVTLARAVLPGMVTRGAGAIVNVASLLSLSGPLRLGMAGRATYAAAKSFQLVFTQSLAGELEGTGVHVMVCLPGMVESEFHGGRALAGRPGRAAAHERRGLRPGDRGRPRAGRGRLRARARRRGGRLCAVPRAAAGDPRRRQPERATGGALRGRRPGSRGPHAAAGTRAVAAASSRPSRRRIFSHNPGPVASPRRRSSRQLAACSTSTRRLLRLRVVICSSQRSRVTPRLPQPIR